jgi:hypothetical protein
VLCGNTIAVHFSFNQAPDAFGFGASQGNAIHHNLLAENGDGVVFSAPDTGADNVAIRTGLPADADRSARTTNGHDD